MTTLAPVRITLPPLHSGQADIEADPSRFKVLACGRRWGKTLYGVGKAFKAAGEGGRIWWVAPTYKLAQEGWRYLGRLVSQLPDEIVTVRESEMSITFSSGGLIQVRSADNPWALRGAGLDGVVLDEAAFMDEKVWSESLRPTLTDRQGWALFISTPNGHNWFWELWEFAHHGQGWRAWQKPTSTNPYIPRDELELARQQMGPAAFAQEYEASFELIGNAIYGQFERSRHVHSLSQQIELERVKMDGRGAFGLDYGVRDLSALVVIERDTAGRIWVRECWAEAGGDERRISGAVDAFRLKYGGWPGRTDPTIGFAASKFNWNRADSAPRQSVKARDVRIGYVHALLNLGLAEGRALPGLCFDKDGPGVMDLVREIEGYHYEEDTKGIMAVCRESHKNDDRVAALEYAVEELEGGRRLDFSRGLPQTRVDYGRAKVVTR